MKNTYWLYGMAVAIGIVVWIGISMVSGRREAFDSELYYRIGMPVVCIASAIFGFLEPNKSWRWGILPLLGQFSWMLLTQGPGNWNDCFQYPLCAFDHNGEDRSFPGEKA